MDTPPVPPSFHVVASDKNGASWRILLGAIARFWLCIGNFDLVSAADGDAPPGMVRIANVDGNAPLVRVVSQRLNLNLGDANRVFRAWRDFDSPGFSGILTIGT